MTLPKVPTAPKAPKPRKSPPAPTPRLPRDVRPRRRVVTVLLLAAYVAIPGLLLPTIVSWYSRSNYYNRAPDLHFLLVLSWVVCFGLLYLVGLWRFHRLRLFTPRQRLAVVAAPPVVATLLALLVDPALFGYTWIGLGVASTWGLAWSEGTAAFLKPGPIARWGWRAVGLAWPAAIAVLGVDAFVIVVCVVFGYERIHIAPYVIQAPFALLLLIVVWWRSASARRAARAWIATAYPPPVPVPEIPYTVLGDDEAPAAEPAPAELAAEADSDPAAAPAT